MKFLDSLYALALYAYPRDFRLRFGPEMRQLFRTRCQQARREKSPPLPRLLLSTAADLLATSFKERLDSMMTARFGRRLGYIATGAVLLLGVSTTMVRAYVIPTPSMEPSLRRGDHILVNRLAHAPQHDELIVFHYPVDPAQTYIKRIVGLPGDHIRLVNKQVIRNGQPLTEDYTKRSAAKPDDYRDNFPAAAEAGVLESGKQMLAHDVTGNEVVVPAGELFVLGDNRDISFDSRYFGFVPVSSVIGRPWFVFWSYDSAARQTRWDRTWKSLEPGSR